MNRGHWHSGLFTGVVIGFVALLQACTTAPVASTSARTPPERSVTAVTQGNDVALLALSLLDKRYSYGGRSPVSGLDCSGLVSHVYREAAGVNLNGSAATMAQKTKPIATQALYPGDLVFFNTLNAPYSHVGVYVGEGKFVHAANERTGVRVDKLSDRYYAARFEGARTLWD